jgi:hypothetical protein
MRVAHPTEGPGRDAHPARCFTEFTEDSHPPRWFRGKKGPLFPFEDFVPLLATGVKNRLAYFAKSGLVSVQVRAL